MSKNQTKERQDKWDKRKGKYIFRITSLLIAIFLKDIVHALAQVALKAMIKANNTTTTTVKEVK